MRDWPLSQLVGLGALAAVWGPSPWLEPNLLGLAEASAMIGVAIREAVSLRALMGAKGSLDEG